MIMYKLFISAGLLIALCISSVVGQLRWETYSTYSDSSCTVKVSGGAFSTPLSCAPKDCTQAVSGEYYTTGCTEQGVNPDPLTTVLPNGTASVILSESKSCDETFIFLYGTPEGTCNLLGDLGSFKITGDCAGSLNSQFFAGTYNCTGDPISVTAAARDTCYTYETDSYYSTKCSAVAPVVPSVAAPVATAPSAPVAAPVATPVAAPAKNSNAAVVAINMVLVALVGVMLW